jgi:hypothetical protein
MAKNLSAGWAGDMLFKTHRKAGRSIRLMKCITFLPNEQGKNSNLKNVAHENVRILTKDQLCNFETSRIGQKTSVPFTEWLERL